MTDTADPWRSDWQNFVHRFADGSDLGVHIRFRRDGDRYAVADLYLEGGEITGTTLRSLRLGQYEAMAQAAGEPPATSNQEPSLAELRAWTEKLRRAVSDVDAIEAKWKERKTARRPKLSRPDRNNPAAFYEAVAAAYREHVQETRAVAVRIAEEAGVPVTTAHRWIREARRRGALPAGSQGRAG